MTKGAGEVAPAGSIAVIVPLYNAAARLAMVLPPLTEALASGAVREVLIVDDGSDDDGPEICRASGFEVLSSGGRLGPSASRNVGAAAAASDILLFIDSDVVMHADVPDRVRAALDTRPDCVAVFGSYDDRPPARGIVSQYRNLLHHFVHHQAAGEASTFWAGCGAIRRAAFLEVGGFDAARYPRPAIEDIEIGYRIRRRGWGILLAPQIQGTHLKRWTLSSMVTTDIFQRALPWTRLMLEPGNATDVLNVSPAERLKALVAIGFWGALLATVIEPGAALVALGLLAVAGIVNRRFFAVVWRQKGLVHTASAVVLHQLYYLYSVLGYVYCRAEHLVRR